MYAAPGRRSGEPIEFGVTRTVTFSGLLALALGVVGGCGSPSSRSLAEGGPADHTREIARAVDRGGPEDVERLIVALDSDDPGERMLAISGLGRLTGKTFGYDFADSRAERTAAIGRWVEWWRAERAEYTRTWTERAGREGLASGSTGDGA